MHEVQHATAVNVSVEFLQLLMQVVESSYLIISTLTITSSVSLYLVPGAS